MKETKQWTYDDPNWAETNEQVVKDWLRLGEQCFDSLYATSDTITDRAFTVIQYAVLLSGIFGGYLFGHLEISPLSVGAIAAFILNLAAIGVSFSLIMPRKSPSPGGEPRYVTRQDIGEAGFRAYLFSELAAVQEKIDSILEANKSRMERIRFAFILLILSPVVGLAAASIAWAVG